MAYTWHIRATLKEDFRHLNEFKKVIKSIDDVGKRADQKEMERLCMRVWYIVGEYQEQPHLLDPHLETLLSDLFDCVKNNTDNDGAKHLAYRVLYLLTKVRGYKVVTRMMPHEVGDLEFVVSMLKLEVEGENLLNPTRWENRYILMLWLSIVGMIPFDMKKFDHISGEEKKPIAERIMELGKTQLGVVDKSMDAAAYMLSKFMTRSDVKESILPGFMEWCMQTLDEGDLDCLTSQRKVHGVLVTLALLFKHGQREGLAPLASTVLTKLRRLKLNESVNSSLRKLAMKMTQRIALTFLKPKVAQWRYSRGSRSLSDNLCQEKPITNNSATKKAEETSEMEEDEDYDIPDQLEDVIEMLLNGLRDYHTIVRWSAAKGIGRVTSRLPKELGDEVLGSVMDLFNSGDSDKAWHGGCMALAELGRRGLIVPSRLPEVVPVIIKALNYDEKHGHSSVGTHVRDAACYVCWAFARAYEPEDIKLYVEDLAKALVTVTLYDREVSIRRAASAAFQENVGRQGQFPHGIDIITTCDYFAVGNVNLCYHELSSFVGDFPYYTEALILHLTHVKLIHWDESVRLLSAQALNLLAKKKPEFVAKNALPALLQKSMSEDLNTRHGAVVAAAFLITALSEVAVEKDLSLSYFVGDVPMELLKSLVTRCQEAEFFKGAAGEPMRRAVCCLIEKISASNLPFHADCDTIDLWNKFIDECVVHLNPDVQKAAIAAIPVFFSAYYKQSDGNAIPASQEKIIKQYVKELNHRLEKIRIGFTLALGALPNFFLRGQFQFIISTLISAARKQEKSAKFAEARQHAIFAITSLCRQVISFPDPCLKLDEGLLETIYEVLFDALNDYTIDVKGDIGALVREASMLALKEITSLLVKTEPSLIKPEWPTRIFVHLVQQGCEKIDRTRSVAGETLEYLLYHYPEIPYVKDREKLEQIIPFYTNLKECSPGKLSIAFKTGKMESSEAWLQAKEESEAVEKARAGLEKAFQLYTPQDSGMNDPTRPWIPPTNCIFCIVWGTPQYAFPILIQLLEVPTYAPSVMLGLTVSVGGLTESLVRSSSTALTKYISHNYKDATAFKPFGQLLLKVCSQNVQNNRVMIPMLKMLDLLLGMDSFAHLAEEEDPEFICNLLDVCKRELTGSRVTQKILVSVNVYCGLLQFKGNVRKKVITQLLLFLCNKLPIVRKVAAEKFYEALTLYGDEIGGNVAEVMEILSETMWDKPVEELKPIRNNLCAIFDVPVPVPKKATTK